LSDSGQNPEMLREAVLKMLRDECKMVDDNEQ
jgi:hypothetical protein